MTIDWTSMLAPVVGGAVAAAGLILGALVTGLLGRLKTWLDAHGQAAAASAVASASAVIQPALQTGASVIAGKISSGALDYTNRAAVTAEAMHEVSLVEQRVPGALAIAQPVAGALVASIMGKVDAMVVASPTIPSTPIVPSLAAPAPPPIPVSVVGQAGSTS